MGRGYGIFTSSTSDLTLRPQINVQNFIKIESKLPPYRSVYRQSDRKMQVIS